MMSTISSLGAEVWSRNVPCGETGTTMKLAMSAPGAKLLDDVPGNGPNAQAVVNPAAAACVTVTFTATA